MRRTVIVLPNLFGPDPDNSPLLQKLPSLATLAELGEVKRLRPLPEIETPEAVWLGMRPDEGQLRQGPLTVSALGADPPDRSTHFHVSLMGFADGNARQVPQVVPEEELRLILDKAQKLNSKSLTFLPGENLDHGLVWEGLGDMSTTAATEIAGKGIKSNLPEGDADRELRRFIDDSINLLTELEFNHRRADEQLPPLNMLWPWGHGVRRAVPNLLFKRGERAQVESNSLRMAGLTRLVGYRHGDRHALGRGTATRLEHLAEVALENDLTILLIDAPGELRAAGLLEELHWFLREMDARLLKPVLDEALRGHSKLALIGTGPSGGLATDFMGGVEHSNIYPFDERSLEEKSLPVIDVWVTIAEALRLVGQD